MRLNNGEYLNVIEEDILYTWGCPDLTGTVLRLGDLAKLTMDPAMKQIILNLAGKLVKAQVDPSEYAALHMILRKNLQTVSQGKIRMANQLAELMMERDKKNGIN